MFIPSLLVCLMIISIWFSEWAMFHRLLIALVLRVFLVEIGWHHSFLLIILVLESCLIVIIADLLLRIRLVDSVSIITALRVWRTYCIGTAALGSLRRSDFLGIWWYDIFSLDDFCGHLGCCDPLTCHNRGWSEYIIVLMTLVELSVTIGIVSYPSTILSQILFHHIYTLRARLFHFRLLILVSHRFIELLFRVSLPWTSGACLWLQV